MPEPSGLLYHGGAPGFRPGDLIEPHATKRVDGCSICQAGGDANHRPDSVFATVNRLYAKFYASKYQFGWLYIVEPVGELAASDDDPFEAYYAPAFRVVRVSERAVLLTMSERRHLWKDWAADDRAKGRPADYIGDRRIKAMFGIW